MKNLLILALIAFATYQYVNAQPTTVKTVKINGYTLAELNDNPIPEKEYFQLLDAIALQHCEINDGDHGYSTDSCNTFVTAKLQQCKRSVLVGTHVYINTHDEHEQLGSYYYACLMPIPNCRNVSPEKKQGRKAEYCFNV